MIVMNFFFALVFMRFLVSAEGRNISTTSDALHPELLNLRLGFARDVPQFSSVQVLRLLKDEELEDFAKLTRTYLRVRHVALVRLDIEGQEWRRFQHFVIEEDKLKSEQEEQEVESDTSHRTTVFIQDQDDPREEIEDVGLDPATRVWTISMKIEAYSNTSDIPSMLLEDGPEFLEILSIGLDHVFLPHNHPSLVGGNEKDQDSTKKIAWVLSTLTLSLTCLLAVMVLRCKRDTVIHHDPKRILGTSPASSEPKGAVHRLLQHRNWRHQRMPDDSEKNFKLDHIDGEDILTSSIFPEDGYDNGATANEASNRGETGAKASRVRFIIPPAQESNIVSTDSMEGNSIFTTEEVLGITVPKKIRQTRGDRATSPDFSSSSPPTSETPPHSAATSLVPLGSDTVAVPDDFHQMEEVPLSVENQNNNGDNKTASMDEKRDETLATSIASKGSEECYVRGTLVFL